MRRIAALLVLIAACACISAEPSADDLKLAEKYMKAAFSPGAMEPTKDFGAQKFYRLPDSTKIWIFASGYTVVETPDKATIRIYIEKGVEYGRELTLPSGRMCAVDAEGTIEWGVVMEKAPDFSLRALGSGARVRLSDAKGKLALLDFWASWCGPCMDTLPETEALYEKYKDRGLVVYGINIEGDAAKASKAAKYLGLTFPVLMAEPDAQGEYDWNCAQVEDYRVHAIPALFLIDADGTIVALNPDEEEIEKRLRR